MDALDVFGILALLVALGAIIWQWLSDGPGLQGGRHGKN